MSDHEPTMLSSRYGWRYTWRRPMTDLSLATVEYAIRYCMTRHSYAFEDGLDLADRHWVELSQATCDGVIEQLIDRDLDNGLDRLRWPRICKALEATDD